MGVGHKLITTRWGTPAAMLMCAGGFAFHGERAWLNERVFCVDNAKVCQMMARLYRNEQFHAARPGQTFWMEGHRLKKVLDEAPFLTTAPAESWPARSKREGSDGDVPDYAPATGRRTLEPGEAAELETRLGEFAAALVGGTVFKGLCSILHDAAKGRTPTFALVLRDGDERRVYAYAPTACAFVPGEDEAEEHYLAGFECWAPDFLAVLRGELGPIALTYARARLWNALPERFRFDLFGELYRMSHPLRRPAEYLRLYQRLWAGAKDVEPIVFRR
jgi:hypothetical protein